MTISNQSIASVRSNVIPPGHASLNSIYVESACGALIRDVEGREYIDFSGGIGVMNVGHSHPRVVEAIKAQAEKFTHTCFMVVPYEPAVNLAERLCAATPVPPPSMALFINSGAEAVENAVKIARYATKRPAVIAFDNAYHGRTLLTMTLTSKVKPYKYGFGPFAPEIYRIPFAYCYRCSLGLSYPACDIACADCLKQFFVSGAAAETTAAVIAEPIQGEGGFITPPPEYFPRIAKICRDNGILFIADEIQTGMGRTGRMFAIEHWGIQPDLMTVAKSLAAGMPLSAVVGKREIMETVHPSGLGGTYGANPVACSAALAVMDIFAEEKLLQRADALGRKLLAHFTSLQEEFEIIGDVRGRGAMLALELVRSRERREPAADEAKALVRYCLEHGLVLLSCGTFGNVIRTLMPLVITDEHLERGISILADGLKAVSAKP
ncbi:MAG: 5-aminovalerate aminotransferase DavT [Syntrophaceae bacterium PtaU1.Bin231]|nr:MAG: 5-aminovalerate aminotransferase DavT [Syntrophaceae bacterium PtaU1.Bin231]